VRRRGAGVDPFRLCSILPPLTSLMATWVHGHHDRPALFHSIRTNDSRATLASRGCAYLLPPDHSVSSTYVHLWLARIIYQIQNVIMRCRSRSRPASLSSRAQNSAFLKRLPLTPCAYHTLLTRYRFALHAFVASWRSRIYARSLGLYTRTWHRLADDTV
jgi:hypothetical protein